MQLQAIRERKAAKVAEARKLANAADAEKRSLSAEESATFDKLKAEIEGLEADEARAVFLSESERRMAGTPITGAGESLGDLERGVSLLDVVQARIEGRSLTGAAAEFHAEAERRSGRKAQGVFVPLSVLEKRADNLTTTAGELVPTDHRADQYIGPLRDSLIVRSLGVRVLSNLSGNVEIPKYGSGLTAGWVNENEALSQSGMTFESVSLKPRHVGAITSWSRQLAQQSNPSIEALLRDDLAYAVGAEVDRAIIAGDGVKEPLGVVNLPGVQTADMPTTWAELLAVEGLLEDANITPTAWYGRAAAIRPLRAVLKDTGAGASYLAGRTQLGDLPVHTSNAAPADTAILGDWSQIILGTWGTLDILVNPYEGEAFRRGNVLIRAMMTCDTVARHDEAFVVATAGTP